MHVQGGGGGVWFPPWSWVDAPPRWQATPDSHPHQPLPVKVWLRSACGWSTRSLRASGSNRLGGQPRAPAACNTQLSGCLVSYRRR